MIVQWFMTAVQSVFNKVFDIMPAMDPPSWFTGAGVALGNLFSGAASMGVWVPIPLALVVMQVLFMAMMGGAIIKLFRIIASFLTAGGGSAA